MFTNRKIKLETNEHEQLAIAHAFYQNGTVLLDRLLEKSFRDNLSDKDCEKAIDIIIDNLSNYGLMTSVLYNHISDISGYSSFYIDGMTKWILEEY